MIETVEAVNSGYRFIPGVSQYSCGIGAIAGFTLERVRFSKGVLRLVGERNLLVDVLAVATALARNREVAAAIVEAGHEIVSHHYRWIDYQHVPISVERGHVRLAIETLAQVRGTRAGGWVAGRG